MSEPAGSSIYDLGYRRYEGERIGRKGTLFTLYVHGLRSAFGLGRKASAKIFPIGLAIIAMIPAIVQLGVGAIVSGVDQHVELIKHDDYFEFIRIILVLFCAAVAPELVGRDQRNRTLSLYFSRAVSRVDYTLAKFAALVTAMLFLTLVPQLVLFIGNGLADDDLSGYVSDNGDKLLPIVAASLLLSGVIAAVGLVIAAYLPRRAYATAAIVGLAILTTAVANIILETAESAVTRYVVLVSPILWEGLTRWLFGVEPSPGSGAATADLNGWLYLAATLVAILVSLAVTHRRFVKVTT